MRIRAATPADAAGIAAVQTRTWLDAYGDIVAAEMLAEAIALRPARWSELLAAGSPTWVAEVDGRIAGIMSAGPARDAGAPASCGELWMLYVAPEAQRGGLGRALAETALEHLRGTGHREAVVWVFEANAAGRAFYEHTGWRLDEGSGREDAWAREVRYRRPL